METKTVDKNVERALQVCRNSQKILGCACLKSLVEKFGWVKYKKRYTKEGKNIGDNQKFFIVETNIPRKNGPGNIGIFLNNCFICGRKIPV